LFAKSLRLYPTDVWALNNRGLAYVRMEKRDKARRDFEAALAIDPGFEAARKNLDTVSEDWLDRMAAQRVTWLVTDADDAEINDILACPEAKSRAVLTTWYGRIRIFKIG